MKTKKNFREDDLHDSPDFNVKETRIEWSYSSENYGMDTLYEIENNAELIRMEMNTIDFPLFTKNKKMRENHIMTYEFNNTKNQYLKVMPLAEYKIPGEFEEKIFLALMKLYKKNNHNQIIYTDFYTLISEMNLTYSGRARKDLKIGLKALGGATYEFNNLFYSNEQRKVLSDNLQTNMFSIRTIKFSEAQEVNNPETMKWFRNSKIKEIVQIKFSRDFYDNIIRKGFLYFDRQDLLQIENSIARTLYMMITKWRNKELYVKRYSRFLASRIPLSWKSKNIPKTIKLLKEAFENLKQNGVIKNYKFDNVDGNENSFFEICFDESHNKNYYQKILGEKLENSNIADTLLITNQIEEKALLEATEVPLIEKEITKQTRELLALLPEKARTLTTMEGKVEKAIKKHGYDYTKAAVLYTNANAKSSFGKYFDGTIAQNWHEEFM
ncbi:MAG: hypothetical protein ACRC6U_05065, partial [Fusobacteriaceae bacterium]